MARRRAKKQTRRRRKSGISILGIAETVALSNVATQTLFNVNAYDFFMGGADFGGLGTGANKLSLRELMNPSQVVGREATYTGTRITGSRDVTEGTMGLIKANLNENWMTGAAGMITIPLAFKLGKKLGRPAISKINNLLKQAGVASTIKV